MSYRIRHESCRKEKIRRWRWKTRKEVDPYSIKIKKYVRDIAQLTPRKLVQARPDRTRYFEIVCKRGRIYCVEWP